MNWQQWPAAVLLGLGLFVTSARATPVPICDGQADALLIDACAALQAATTDAARADALIALAASLRDGSRAGEADALLDQAATALGVPTEANAEHWAALEYQRFGLLTDRMEETAAEHHLAAAQAHLDAAGRQRSVLYAQVLADATYALVRERRLDEAAARLDEADAILVSLHATTTPAAAGVLRHRTNLAFARQDFPATLALAERDLAMRRQLGGDDNLEAIDPLSTIGAIRSMQGDFDGAEAALQKGLRIAKHSPDRFVDEQLSLISNLTTLELDRADAKAALPTALRGVELAERRYGADGAQVFRMLLVLGGTFEALERYADGWRVYERAAQIEAAHRDDVGPQRRIRLAFGQARMALRLGDAAASRAALARMRTLIGDGKEYAYWRGWAAALDCKLAARNADWPTADRSCEEAARELGTSLGQEHAVVVAAIVGRCLAQASGGLTGDACDEVQRRDDADAISSPLVRHLALAGLAQRAEERDDLDAALVLRVRALATARQTGRADPTWAAEAALASLLERRGQHELAIFFDKLSVRSIEDMRTQFAADTARFERGFLADKLGVYRQLADWLFAAGRFDEALEVTRLLKTEEQFDFNQRAGPPPGSPATIAGAPWTSRETGLDRDWQRVGTTPPGGAAVANERLGRLRRLTPDERARFEALTRDDVQRERELALLMSAFIDARAVTGRREDPVAGPLRNLPSLVGQAIGPGDLFALLLMAGDHVNLFVASRRGASVQRLAVRPDELSITVGRYLETMERRADAGDAGARLDGWIGRPLDQAASEARARRIVLVTDGALRYLPIAALHGDTGYLIERYTIEYSQLLSAASNAVFLEPTLPRARRRNEVRAFGVTRSWGRLPALPGVRQELCDIVRGPVLGLDAGGGSCRHGAQGDGPVVGAGFADAQFTQDRMRQALARDSGFSMLHIGTHFSLRPGSSNRSWLLLGDGGHLTLDTLRSWDFRGLSLVTLSACQTGMAGAVDDAGQEIEGLPSVIQARGAQAVVSSLWRVEDLGTARLMAAFYRRMQSGLQPADALRAASLEAMHRGSAGGALAHPYDWAAFRLTTVLAPVER